MRCVIAAVATHLCLCLTHLCPAQTALDDAVEEVATRSIAHLAEPQPTLAVVDFANLDGTVAPLGQHLAEAVTTQLLVDNPDQGLQVTERRHLHLVLQARDVTVDDLFDPQNLRTVGAALGVAHILTGTLSDLGDEIEINARLIAVEHGRIIAAHRVRLPESSIPPGLLEETPTLPASPDHRKEVGGVMTEVISAYRDGDTIHVELTLTAVNTDLRFELYGVYGRTRIITSTGNEHDGVHATLAGKEGRDFAEALLVRGVPSKATVAFSAPADTADSIALLHLEGKAGPFGSRRELWSVHLRSIRLQE